MLATKTYVASDPDEYVSLIRGGRVEVIVSQRGVFDASVTRVDLGDLWMQRARESLPRTFRAALAADRATLCFLASPQPAITILSSPMEYSDMALLPPGEALCTRSVAPCEWGVMSLPIEEFRRYGVILRRPSAPWLTPTIKSPFAVTIDSVLWRGSKRSLRPTPTGPIF